MANLWASRAAPWIMLMNLMIGVPVISSTNSGWRFNTSINIVVGRYCDCLKHQWMQKPHSSGSKLDTEMVKANNDAAVWLVDGYEPTAT